MIWFWSISLAENPRYISANCASAVSSSMAGASASGGRSLRTCATFAWIWVSAALVSKLSLRCTVMTLTPCVLDDSR